MSGTIAPSQAAPIADPRQSLAGLRVVRLRDFEEAVPLPLADRDDYRRRFSTLFVDDSRQRRGGTGQVSYALNAQGEALALKTLRPSDHMDADLLAQTFRREYEAHLTLNGAQGFPRLYGFGYAGDTPAIVMEWVHGVTLADARASLAVDAAGRLPTLMVARIGRALFELLVRMEQMGSGLVHRDLSPANVMVRTDHLSLERQVQEGAFDLCLVDLGSAESVYAEGDTSLTSATGVVRGATADYAPPEMLTHDLPHLERLRRSPKVDVYACGSILYELMSGRLPYDLSSCGASPYRAKADARPARPVGIHAATPDLERTLAAEPEVATEVAVALLDLSARPGAEDVRLCLELVDDQLADLVMSCLEARQEARPTAEAMRSALSTFCSCHPENVRRALAGEQLLPCTADAAWYAGVSPLALRRMVRSVGTAVSAGVWLVVVVGTALLVQGTPAGLAGASLTLSAPVVGLCLALPALLGRLVRGGDAGTRAGFARASLVLLACSLLDAAVVSQLSFDVAARAQGLLSAVLASFAAGWCPIVLDYATTVVPGLVHEARRRLPAPRAGLVSASPTGLATDAPSPTSDDVPYEVPDHDDDET